MRERLRELGGSLEIQSSGRGTRIIANIPLTEGRPGEAKPDLSVFSAIERRPAIVRNASRKRILLNDRIERLDACRQLFQFELELCQQHTKRS